MSHPSWFYQIDIYFSILTRRVISCETLNFCRELIHRLMLNIEYYKGGSAPFEFPFASVSQTSAITQQ